jgi:YYY domain-containing protein
VPVDSLGFLDLIIWLIVIQSLSFAVLPFTAWIAPNAPDKGYSLSKVTGFFLFASTCWVLTVCGLITESEFVIKVVYVAILALGWWGYRKFLSVSELRALLKKYAWSVEGIFLGLTFFYLGIRFFNPEIFWGEKPMDLTFLGFFVRNHELPPQDPWAAGSPMTYYYVGIYYVAAVLKLTGIPVPIGYNIAISMVAGWIAVSLYGLFLLVTGRVWFAVAASVLLLFANDPELLRLVFVERKIVDFNTFWAATRVFVTPGFFEYTSWSLLFADLHAHVIAIPFTIVVTTLATLLFLGTGERFTARGAVLRILLGAMHGSLFGINTWDFITFGGVVGLLILFARVKPFWEAPKNEDGSDNIGEVALVTVFTRVIALAWDALLIGASAGLMAWLYQRGVSFKQVAGWGWVYDREFNKTHMFVRTLGYWMIPTVVCLAVLGVRKIRVLRERAVLGFVASIAVAGLAALPYLASLAQGIHRQPIGLMAYCALVVGAAYFVLWSCKETPERRVSALFVVMPAFLMMIVELFFLIDRMNTIFKGYMAVWILSGISTMLLIYFVGQQVWQVSGKKARYAFVGLLAFFVSLQIVGAVLNIYATVTLQRVPVRFYTLNGTAFLPEMPQAREDAQVVNWLNKNVSGMATILEAHGDAYREFTRISMNTGLPTILGWEHHIKQRGLTERALIERKRAIRAIYSSDDLAMTKDLLVKYNIDYIVVGQLERSNNRPFYPEKFDGHPEIFTKVASFGNTHIYVTYFSKFNPNYKGGSKS